MNTHYDLVLNLISLIPHHQTTKSLGNKKLMLRELVFFSKKNDDFIFQQFCSSSNDFE